MIYSEFCGEKVSRLGFGCMRLPLKEDNKTIDEKKTYEMTEFAIAKGVNYFDTAWPYHGGLSEVVMGKVLSGFDRGTFFLADKYPGHQKAEKYTPEETFETQLKKCGVDYFDYYLLHNVCENSFGVYTDEQWGIVEYFKKQKELGRIRHLGLSSHSQSAHLPVVLDYLEGTAEFVQLQLNYLDWTLQNGREKYETLVKRGLPCIVMEPVRGGKLASLPKGAEEQLRTLRDETPAAWAFRFLQGYDNMKVILSGMSNFEQLRENVATFETLTPLNAEETKVLEGIAGRLAECVPCTACRYCVEGCPQGLDIPGLIAAYNDAKFNTGTFTPSMYLSALGKDKGPESCIACGACQQICPQKIDIPDVMTKLAELKKTLPDWDAICAERERLAKQNG